MPFNPLIADQARPNWRADAMHSGRREKTAVVIYFFSRISPFNGLFRLQPLAAVCFLAPRGLAAFPLPVGSAGQNS